MKKVGDISLSVLCRHRRRGCVNGITGELLYPLPMCLLFYVFLSVFLLGISACTDTDLELMKPPVVKAALEANVCTLAPEVAEYPYKVLFVIDRSESMKKNDANNARIQAAQRVVAANLNNQLISFAFIGFGFGADALSEGFTRDTDAINDALSHLDNNNLTVGTNYTKALEVAYKMISRDAAELTPKEIARTTYDIQWLSDGRPWPCTGNNGASTNDIQSWFQITQGTKDLMSLADSLGVFSMRMSTILLFPEGGSPPGGKCDGKNAKQYLKHMAETLGGGKFALVGTDAVAFNIEFTTIKRGFRQQSMFLVNEHRVVVKDAVLPDSDGDGIPDEDEELSSGMLTIDSNGNGCSDAVEDALWPDISGCLLCQKEIDAKGKTIDSDGDGVPDCAEKALGWDADLADSDGDGFPDGIELRFGTSPLVPDMPTGDLDNDGRSDGEEIRLGTNPLTRQSNDVLEFIYSEYEGVNIEDPSDDHYGCTCYELTVDNVRLAETVAAEDVPRGTNRLCLYMVQRRIDATQDDENVFTRACVDATYVLDDNGVASMVPATGVLHLEPEDFKRL